MKGLPRFAPMRQRGPVRAIPPMPVIDVARTVPEQREKDDARYAYWVKMVGETRAAAAAAIAAERTGSRTLPELLTEDWLRRQAARYVAQLDLGYARPDFTVFDTPGVPGMAALWRIHGVYWHGTPEAIARDSGQRDMLQQATAQGVPVGKVIDIWETSIYEGDTALEIAYYHGTEIPRQ